MPATMTRIPLSTGGVLDCPPRFGTPRNLDRRTLGAEVAEIARRLGQPLMPAQQYIVDVALELDDDGLLIYDEVDLAMMRRMGKTTIVRSLLVHRCRVMAKRFGPQFTAYTAQDGKHARRKWEEDHVRPIDKSAYGPLGKAREPGRYGRVKFDNNDPGIFWNNGSCIRPTAPTETAGHGDALDLGVIDEAFAHVDDRVEQAFGPAMLTRQCAQLWVMSAAGTDKSPYWWDKVSAGRAMCESGKFSETVAYFEWSIGDDEDYQDPAVWRRRLPALGHTVPEAKVQAELDKALRGEEVDADDEEAGDRGLERFLRPYMGRWCRIPSSARRKSLIPPEAWARGRDLGSKPADPVVFGIEVPQDRSYAVIVLAAPSSNGGEHVEVIDTVPVADAVARCAALHLGHLIDPSKDPRVSLGVALKASGPAGSLVHDLKVAGVPVHQVKALEWKRACAGFFDAVIAGQLRHLGQDSLDAAVVAAAKKVTGDGWEWDHRGGPNDLAPLSAATAARWVSLTAEPPPKKKPVFW